MNEQVSIDWCEDSIKRSIPWDDDQYVTVRRFTGREKRKRQSLAGTFRVGPEMNEDMEIQMSYDKLKDFEWGTCITDFRLSDSKDKVYLYADAKSNQKVFDHISGELEKFIDNLILEVNKENSAEDIKEIEENSNGSSEMS